MVYPFPQASRDIASLAIWSSHKVAASFSSQPCSSGACIGGLMTGAIWNVVNGECRLLAHRDASLRRTDWVAIEGIADMPGASRRSGCDATDPKRTSAAAFAAMHCPDLLYSHPSSLALGKAHEAAGVHRASRQRCYRMAARGARTAGRARAAHRRALTAGSG